MTISSVIMCYVIVLIFHHTREIDTDKITSGEIYRRTNTKRELIGDNVRRKMRFFGHGVREDGRTGKCCSYWIYRTTLHTDHTPALPSPSHPHTLTAHTHATQTTVHASQSPQQPHAQHRVLRQPHKQTKDY